MAGFAGIVLAGGRSRRMGSDKSIVMLAGRPLIEIAAERLGRQVERLAISANDSPERFAFLGLPVVADTIPGFAGPLAGILSGLRWAERSDAVALATAATDTPFFPGDLVERLAGAADDRRTIAVASCQGRLHPVFALWPLSVADALEAFLQSGAKAGVLAFIETQPHRFVDFEPLALPGGSLDPFFNINTPADLETAELIASELAK
jgi:molybdopterin-guanine dinucleotide biosynthesis protein A